MVDSATVHPFPDTQIFRDVFDASPIGIVVETLEGQPLFANPSFCSLLGFSEDELRNKHCVDFSPPEDAKKDWELFQQLKQGLIDHYQLDKRYFRRDGSLVWGRLSLSLLNSRTTPLVIAMVENITDIKRAEEALREGEERLRLAVQAGRMFAYSWDARTDLIERSGESRAILGLEEDTSTSQALSAMIHPEDREKVKAAITQLSGESPNLHIDYRMIRPDAKIIWVERNSRDWHGC
jgi:PAS domain S-box-containing protein